jgi:hypothetical protein
MQPCSLLTKSSSTHPSFLTTAISDAGACIEERYQSRLPRNGDVEQIATEGRSQKELLVMESTTRKDIGEAVEGTLKGLDLEREGDDDWKLSRANYQSDVICLERL